MFDSDGVQAKVAVVPDGAVKETSMSDLETPAALTPVPELHESAAHHLAELRHDPDVIRHFLIIWQPSKAQMGYNAMYSTD